MLDAVLKEKQRSGKETGVQHKKNISDGDWTKIEEYFNDVLTSNDPRKLTMYVWLLVSSHFCLRGGELQARLKKDDLVFSMVDGKETISIATEFITKNSRGGLAGKGFQSKGVIDDEQQVATVKRYFSKLHPRIDRLFQRARVAKGEVLPSDMPCWFIKSPLSHNLLGMMMKMISESAGLSTVYTNHCVRATSIVRLREAGFEDRKIISVTGHRNVQSLSSYDSLCTKDCTKFAAAIDKKPISASLDSASASPVQSFTAVEKENAAPAGFVLHAPDANFSNVTFNVAPLQRKRKLCLSLKEQRKLKSKKE
eukprot:scpid80614/ scgid35100/ 